MQSSIRSRIVRRPSGGTVWRFLAALVLVPLWTLHAEADSEQPAGETEPKAEAMAGAPSPGPGRSAESADNKNVAAPSVGLRAYIDPETGELTSTPTAEQLEVFTKSSAPSLEFSSEGLETFLLQRGGRGVRIEGRFLSALKVRRNADGSMEVICEDPDHAAAGETVEHDHSTPAQASAPAQADSPAQSQWAVQ